MNSNGPHIFLTTQLVLNAKKLFESVDNHAFRLKKVLGEISEAKTTASNYDLRISFSVLLFDF
ncbi:MAG TPA: hypothetical protein DD662_04755 [Planctomycetaceae bacterium]|nr:hypothetical protein [Planctomycetaceae bacterium]